MNKPKNHLQQSVLQEKQKKYSLKKLSVGLVSVSLGVVMYTGSATSVSAQEITDSHKEDLPNPEADHDVEVSSEISTETIDVEEATNKAVETIQPGSEDTLEALTEEIAAYNEQTIPEDKEASSDESSPAESNQSSDASVEVTEVENNLDTNQASESTHTEEKNQSSKEDETNIRIKDGQEEAKNEADKEEKSTQSSAPQENYVQLVGEDDRKVLFSSHWLTKREDSKEAHKANYDDAEWTDVDLPHDYSINREFSTSNEAESGFLPGGVSWYRKRFIAPEELKNKNVLFHLEGAYMNTEVYVNEQKVGEHHHGYTGAAFDITKYLHTDGKTENIIAVRTENKVPTSRWYSGSGIYRDVNLVVTDKLHVGHYGTKIEAKDLAENKDGDVQTNVKTTIVNNYENQQTFSIQHQLVDADGQVVAQSEKQSFDIEAGVSLDTEVSFNVNAPTLWSVDNPYLYKLQTLISQGDTVVDRTENDYGYRFFNFDSKTGFSLNGKKMKLKGVNMHHDQGALGAVANPAAIERQVKLLKEMGANAIRTSHNPASPALIDIANRYGMLVVEESFDGWHLPKNGNQNDYSNYFTQKIGEGNQIIHGNINMTWAEYDLKEMIRKSQNAPSVIMWSLGNEISEGAGGNPADYIAHAKNLVKWALELDTTRPLTIGDNQGDLKFKPIHELVSKHGGVVGFNYKTDDFMRKLHEEHPSWTFMMSETASSIHTRSWYRTHGQDSENMQLSAYDTDEARVGWGASASESWRRVIENDFIAGEFVWTGFDYLGEPTPWNGIGTGSVSGHGAKPNSSYFGIIDTAGFPKDTYYYYHSAWKDDESTLHLMPTWNKENLKIDENGNVRVDVFTDAKKVSLYLNGKEIASDEATVHTTEAGYTYRRFASTDHKKPYASFNVKYEPGELTVRAWDDNGNEITDKAVGRKSVATYGQATQLKARVTRTELTADGRDLAYVEVDVLDAEGRLVDNASQRVEFNVEGQGALVGVDNGDPTDTDGYKAENRKAFGGKALGIVQATNRAGEITVTVSAEGLQSDTITLSTKAQQTNQDKNLRSYVLANTFYTTVDRPVRLPQVINGRFSNNEEKDLSVTWDQIDESKYKQPGEWSVSGRIADYDITVTVKVVVMEPISQIENYATAIRTGDTLELPGKRRGYDVKGKYTNVLFPVTWDTDSVDLSAEGLHKIKGTADVFGTSYETVAHVRVVKKEQERNIAHKDFEDAPSIYNGYVSNNQYVYDEKGAIAGTLTLNNDDYTGDNYWMGYAHGYKSFVEFIWEKEYSIQNLRLWHYTNEYADLPGPQNVEFYYLDSSSNQYKKIGASNITQVKHTEGNTPYAFSEPIKTSRLRLVMKGANENKAPALTGVEIDEHVGDIELMDSTELQTLKINGQDIKDKLVNNTYHVKTDQPLDVTVDTVYNAALTVAEQDDHSYIIRVTSEDGEHVAEYRIINGDTSEQERKQNLIKAVSLDAGRKYFSPEQIKKIIDEASRLGYTDLHLLVGNEGLRFLPDDLALETDSGDTYSNEDVRNALIEGNKQYYNDPNGTFLSQAEMDDILAYAKQKNMRLIPAVNSPGHMNAILNAMKHLGIENPNYTLKYEHSPEQYPGHTWDYVSNRTVDLNNKRAVDFTKALVKKYAAYFNGKTDIFTIGLDEYANDALKDLNPYLKGEGREELSGWQHIVNTGEYAQFVQYANELAAIVKSENLRPLAFNDGMYYNNITDQGDFDTDIIVSYWTGGFPGFKVAPSSYFAKRGHDVLNTNDHWYYVVGRENKNSGWYNLDQGIDGMKKVGFENVLKNEGEPVSTIGSMIAVWADDPERDFVMDNFKKWIQTFADENADYFRADYSKVDEQLAQIPDDLSSYTPASQKRLGELTENIDRTISRENQKQVDQIAETLKKAIGSLVKTPTGDEEQANLNQRRILSLDAGRKYYSADQIKQIITEISQRGYTDLHLLLGNDGFRFVLDDMTVEAAGKTYSSEEVKSAITKGNRQYYDDPNGNVLTQTEMEDILAHAKQLNVQVIPSFNSPGHMNTLVKAMGHLGIENANHVYYWKDNPNDPDNPEYAYPSEGTLSLKNEEAKAFTKAIIQKFATYFSSHTQYFNIGLDEFANDATGDTRGWKELQRYGEYKQFIDYTNDLVKIVKELGMTAIGFNDGIYYNEDDSHGEFDKDLVISYWTGGWWGYDLASSKYLADKGHKILNTHDAWYYVLGREQGATEQYNFDSGTNGAKYKRFDDVIKNQGADIPTIGSMMAFWADDPSKDFNMENFVEWLDTFARNKDAHFPADYSAVQEELAKVPADLSQMTDESVANWNKAKEKALTPHVKANQHLVDEALEELKVAREGLTTKEIAPEPVPEDPGVEDEQTPQPEVPEVIKDYFKLVVDFDGEQVVYDRKDSDVWTSAEQAREVYDQYLPEAIERDGKKYKRVDIAFAQSDEEAVLTYVYRTDDYEPTPEPEPEVYAGDYEFELVLDGEASTETLTFASRDKALDFVATLNRLYKAAGYRLVSQDNGLPEEYKVSLSFEKIVDKQPDITPEPTPEADKPSEEPGVEEELVPEPESPGTEAEGQQPDESEETPQPEQPAEPEVTPEAKPDTVEATFTFINAEGSVHRGSLGEFANLEQAERRIRQYANELGYTLQNFRLDQGAFLADIEADFSQPLPEPEQPEEQLVRDVEASFEFNFVDGLAHHGSLGYFTTLEQAEKRIRHFANEQGYTLLNLRIEDGKFVADVKENR